MPAHVYANGAWREATSVFVYANGAWRTASDMPVYANGAWRTATLASPETVVNITSSDVEYNLFDRIGLVTGNIVVNIAAGVNIDSTDPELPAFDIGHAFPGANITINNAGTIRGTGGREGRRGDALANVESTAGTAGGTALFVRTANPLVLNNTGRIGGGGGGGGGGPSITWRYRNSQGRTFTRHTRASTSSAGARGFGPTPAERPLGQYGSTTYLNINSGQASIFKSELRGAAGGGPGMPGGTPSPQSDFRGGGRLSVVALDTRNASPSGRGGYSIDGISHVTIVNAGETQGDQVN